MYVYSKITIIHSFIKARMKQNVIHSHDKILQTAIAHYQVVQNEEQNKQKAHKFEDSHGSLGLIYFLFHFPNFLLKQINIVLFCLINYLLHSDCICVHVKLHLGSFIEFSGIYNKRLSHIQNILCHLVIESLFIFILNLHCYFIFFIIIINIRDRLYICSSAK